MIAVEDSIADLTVPVYEIAPGWFIDEIKTIKGCDDARAIVIEQVALLEVSLDETHDKYMNDGVRADPEWLRNSKLQLRTKKATLQALQNLRADLTRKDKQAEQTTRERRIIEVARELDQVFMSRVLGECRERWPEQFE